MGPAKWIKKKKKPYTYTKTHQHEISKHWAKRILKAFRKEKEKQQQVSYKGLGVIMVPTFSIAILGPKDTGQSLQNP